MKLDDDIPVFGIWFFFFF